MVSSKGAVPTKLLSLASIAPVAIHPDGNTIIDTLYNGIIIHKLTIWKS